MNCPDCKKPIVKRDGTDWTYDCDSCGNSWIIFGEKKIK